MDSWQRAVETIARALNAEEVAFRVFMESYRALVESERFLKEVGGYKSPSKARHVKGAWSVLAPSFFKIHHSDESACARGFSSGMHSTFALTVAFEWTVCNLTFALLKWAKNI